MDVIASEFSFGASDLFLKVRIDEVLVSEGCEMGGTIFSILRIELKGANVGMNIYIGP